MHNRNQTQSSRFLFALAAWLAAAGSHLAGQTPVNVNVLTANYTNARSNANLNETILSTLNVNAAQFGKLFSLPVTGAINGQPLYVQNIKMLDGNFHNVVYVATHHNNVYAFDADAQRAPLWQINLGPSVPGTDFNVADLTEIGILSTPVIDSTTNTLYVVAYTKESGEHIYRLHALDITSGQEKFGAPVVISASVPGNSPFDGKNGQVPFTTSDQLQRASLVLLNNVVYLGFGSQNDISPWHGWLLGYNAPNVQQQVSAYNTSPGGWGGAIWQGGRAPAVDANGNIYFATGNGTFDGKVDYAESVIKLATNSGVTAMADWFTPDNYKNLTDLDNDLGSCGPILTSNGWLIAGGKEGVVYLIDQNNLGHTVSGNGQILQSFQAIGFGIYNMAFWDRRGGAILYVRADADVPKAFQIVNNRFQTTPVSQGTTKAALPYDGMAISADGSASYSGILWLTSTTNGNEDGAGTLHAYNALDLSTELWNSDMNSARDGLGMLAKFSAPTIANGKVYVATFSGSLMVYGVISEKALIGQVVNSASGLSGPVAPGEMVTINGADLGPPALATNPASAATTNKIESSLGGTQVMVNGSAAPLLYARQDEVATVIPDAVAGQTSITLQVQFQGQSTPTMNVPVAAIAPGLFTIDGSGRGQGAILNQDESVNSMANPAARGSIVALFGTGGGATDPQLAEDAIATAPYPKLTNSVTVTIGGQPADIEYAGAAPDLAAVFVISARIPKSIQPGYKVPVVVNIGGIKTQAGVWLAVQ
jgi:uncharacterized protein (TIGR03437 family)